ncbi:GNAT family N-acetyltransferase [Ruegeria sp.]|uniref:GNAT family N-acetyltransferase n=1 Tax=Ruegeria sp. TaxID=1879320 RepID=UPI0023209383|nr:GNAT family N-acetyltransferase [Ruegeria sp.]MDA7964073.1 GNAT family N-acetyltransferase [Ruegeria sp.]
MTPLDMALTHAAAFRDARPWSAKEFADLLTNPFTQAIGDARCFALFQVIADEAELLTIATHPDNQRQGLALHRMADWHAAAQKQGATRAFLEVAADNAAAIALYESCGYSRCGMRKAYYQRKDGPNADAILMERALP